MPSPIAGHALHLGLRTILEIGGRLPLRLGRTIGPVLSGIAIRRMGRSRRRIEDHLEIAFPELSNGERDTILRGCSRHLGFMLAEIAWMSRAKPADVEQLCEFEDREHLDEALQAGHGAVIATGHCGNWEMLSARLPIGGIPLTAAARELDHPQLDRLVTRLRTRFGTEMVLRGPAAGRQIMRALGRNRAIALLIDQDIKDVPGVFAPFFGRPAWTASGAAIFALRKQTPVLPGFIHRRPDGTHKIVVHPPLEIPDSGTFEDKIYEVTAAANAAIERQIRAHPEQWVWMHRRWRTQPSRSTE
jgi:KDO2-lipid IV(A) lauroyltransferase